MIQDGLDESSPYKCIMCDFPRPRAGAGRVEGRKHRLIHAEDSSRGIRWGRARPKGMG